MGEIAEMILDGMLCQVCGVFMGDGDGFAVTCRGCGGNDEDAKDKRAKKSKKSLITTLR